MVPVIAAHPVGRQTEEGFMIFKEAELDIDPEAGGTSSHLIIRFLSGGGGCCSPSRIQMTEIEQFLVTLGWDVRYRVVSVRLRVL